MRKTVSKDTLKEAAAMTKTVCDICGKDMPTEKFTGTIRDLNFCISSYGKIWDICTECLVDLNKWMTKRRAESEE